MPLHTAAMAVDAERPHWHEPKVRRALLGLVFVVGVFVIAPVVAMLWVAH
jgi:F0F1-type ATP synthase membrane subunit c/vacuolar-type H+-ATPase subunit K